MNTEECFKKGLLRKFEFPSEVVAKEIKNAERHLENATRCMDAEMHDLAVVSVYTAMFHAARAILFKDGIKERSHICVILYLNNNYPELKNYVKILDVYRRSRHTMLYGIDVEDVAEDANQGISAAKEFIEKTREVIEQKED